MNLSYAYDPDRYADGSVAARGGCSWHGAEGVPEHVEESGCDGEAVVSFQDQQGQWQSGCQRALEELVERGEIEPLGQGA